MKKSPLRSSKPRNQRLLLKLLPLLQVLKRLRSRLIMVRAVAEAVVAEVKAVVVVAGEATVKAVAVANTVAEAEADLDRIARMLMALSRKLVRSLFAVEEEATGVANGAVKVNVAAVANTVATVAVTVAVIVVVTVVTVVVTVALIVVVPEVEPAPRTKAQLCPPRRPPKLNLRHPLNRLE